ncbi:DUF2948 family protein [Silicimonas algicola]|uniref:DUF2948 family protein n=1 Tax=Silicimonas algicola TaxID=1826607 RepID=A0A316G2Z1_9RHOB|nr:DUF2948 family protein [Silicimonas algicola]AZQ66907.1 DUF2948 family protein [Silicimonas algicola]PWK55178.1 hypothetical protein C8D95_10855 [Silicimonas algicola]
MTDDARFEDAAERPLRLKAETAEDVTVLAALVQDAILSSTEMKWEKGHRRFVCLLNRFRWEDKVAAKTRGRGFERVRAVLSIGDALAVRQQGLDRSVLDGDTVLSLLTLAFEPGEDGAGRVVLTFAGDGAVAVEVEAVNLVLQDVTRPYLAPSGRAPSHPD